MADKKTTDSQSEAKTSAASSTGDKAADKTTVKKKASQISENYVLTTSPTFILSYGVDLDHNIFGNSRGSRLSLDFTYDYAALGLMSSPANQYFGTYINYRILF